MGDYISTTDLQNRVGGSAVAAQLTTDSGSTPDSTAMTEAVTTAEGQMNAYLAKQYAVPVSVATYPELNDFLDGCALDLAEYHLRARRPPVPKVVADKYLQRLEELKAMAAGDVDLPAESTPTGSTTGLPRGNYEFRRTDRGAEDMI